MCLAPKSLLSGASSGPRLLHGRGVTFGDFLCRDSGVTPRECLPCSFAALSSRTVLILRHQSAPEQQATLRQEKNSLRYRVTGASGSNPVVQKRGTPLPPTVTSRCRSRSYERFLEGCSSPFITRLAEYLTALRAWCKQCLPSW